jgi:cytochrome c-type biogenesis protein
VDTLFGGLSAGLHGSLAIAVAASFSWGLASLALSPCHLASIPLLVAFINGQPVTSARRAGLLAALFAVGIFGAIVIVGVATAGAGRLVGDIGPWASYAVAGVFLVTGLSLLDVIPANWQAPSVPTLRGRGGVGALVLGLVFGLALGPCTFAYLAPVLGVAFAAGTHSVAVGVTLVAAFALGHCALIVLAGASAGRLRRILAAAGDGTRLQLWRHGSGVLVLVGGLYLLYCA